MAMALWKVKRQRRALRILAEQNTSVRIADGSQLLSWLFCFAAQVVNKMRIGKDENERIEKIGTKMEKTHGAHWRVGLVP